MTSMHVNTYSNKLPPLGLLPLLALVFLAAACGKVKKPLVPQTSDVQYFDYVINSNNQKTFALKGNCLDEEKVHIGSPFDIVLDCTDDRFETVIDMTEASETEWMTPVMALDGWVLETRNTIKRTSLPEITAPNLPTSVNRSELPAAVLRTQGTCSVEGEAVNASYFGMMATSTCRDGAFYLAFNLAGVALGTAAISIRHQDTYGNTQHLELSLLIDQ